MKELGKDIKASDLPIENCTFWHDEEGWQKDICTPLTGVFAGDIGFYLKNTGKVKRCAKIETRYPRDVPEGVVPLPEDKPQLAYSGTEIMPRLHSSYYIIDRRDWIPVEEAKIQVGFVHFAIDVSTDWAAKNFPEIVEAMEYEAITENVGKPLVNKVNLAGHKLGDKQYDLNWNLVSNAPTFDAKEIVDDAKSMAEERKYADQIGNEEPTEYIEWVNRKPWRKFEAEKAFEAGKARGKWEATQWKYETIEDHPRFEGMGLSVLNIIRDYWNYARETKDMPEVSTKQKESE